MSERFWRLRAAFWFWYYACFTWKTLCSFNFAWDMAKALDYIADKADPFYESPRQAVMTELSYWEP